MNNIIWIILLMSVSLCSFGNEQKRYLLKPSGQYGVSYEDFHTINTNLCPDPNYNEVDNNDFISQNKHFCHEILLRIYYPTNKTNLKTPYYKPFILDLQEKVKSHIPNLPLSNVNSLAELKSYSGQNEQAVRQNKFPVLFFSPGLSCQVQMYENIINDLVSHGYVVIGVNSPFISGNLQLPNTHIIKAVMPHSIRDIEQQFINIQSQDLVYSMSHLTEWKTLKSYCSMDFKHIGAFGHSIGGRIVANLVHSSPQKLQAAASLDTAIDPSGASLHKFSIPFIYEISANKINSSPYPIHFELSRNGYLVVISPSPENTDYSYHMNFTDFSTLQYQPTIRLFKNALTKSANESFTLKTLQKEPSTIEIASFSPETYLLIKEKSNWKLSYYHCNKKLIDLEVKNIKGLNKYLSTLHNKKADLSIQELKPINKMLSTFRQSANELTGTGNGWEIAESINTYLLNFFNKYLKNEENSSLNKCHPLAPNTYMSCG